MFLPRVKAYWDEQHRNPSGIVGRIVGERMIRQHRPETEWTLSMLELTPPDRVLEIGFGAGRALEMIAQQVTHGFIAGVDVSRTMVAAARRRNANAIAKERMALTQGDVAFLPLAGEQFSKVLSIQTFYFWPEPLQTLRQLFCVLKRPGTLIVTLSTGVIGPDGERTPGPFGSLQDRLEQQIIPGMYDMGFTTAYLR